MRNLLSLSLCVITLNLLAVPFAHGENNPVRANFFNSHIEFTRTCLRAGGRVNFGDSCKRQCACSDNRLVNPISDRCPDTIDMGDECTRAGGELIDNPYAQCYCRNKTMIEPFKEKCEENFPTSKKNKAGPQKHHKPSGQ